MGKHSKKHSKKDEVSEDLLDAAALSIKKFRKVTKEIGKLSTGQKLVGGLALVAAGLAYLAAQEEPAGPAATAEVQAADEAEEAEAALPRKVRKSPKSKSDAGQAR